MPVEIHPVRSRAELGRFIALPWSIYSREDPWVPPLRFERRRFLDRSKNAFFEHAEGELFLAVRDGKDVGRISAQVDRHFNEFQGNDWGWWGFFECRDDPEAAGALLDAAERWLRARGRDRMVGPADFTTNHECGLLVEGHERPPQLLEPWQHPYYERLVDGAGLTKAMDLLKWELYISDRAKVLPVLDQLAERLEPDHGIKIRHMRKRDLEDEVRRFLEVYNSAWEKNWGFVPLTEKELRAYAKELRPVLDENWAMIAEKDGETVGAALTLPDFNQALRTANGRLFPLGWAKILRARSKIDSVRVFALGVKPEYQHTGVAAGFYIEHFNMAEKTPQKGGEMGWILETNTAMNRAMEAMGGRLVKRFRLYERVFDGASAARGA